LLILIREFKQGRILFARLDHGADIIGLPLKRVPDPSTGLNLWGKE
jgi:hypothetical protein